jgi:hypothetical protein
MSGDSCGTEVECLKINEKLNGPGFDPRLRQSLKSYSLKLIIALAISLIVMMQFIPGNIKLECLFPSKLLKLLQNLQKYLFLITFALMADSTLILNLSFLTTDKRSSLLPKRVHNV